MPPRRISPSFRAARRSRQGRLRRCGFRRKVAPYYRRSSRAFTEEESAIRTVDSQTRHVVTDRPRSRQKYWFTPAMDEEIRSAYHLFIEDNNRRAIGACARKLRLPRWMITRRAAILGLARIKEPEWSIAEIIVLEQCGHLTPAVIRRKLRAKGFRRSANAIRLKIGRMRIKQNLE